MNGGNSPLGYTIIEVMIVLAVSGTMFLIAANFISGKQGRTSFTAGVNETASRIQDVIEQVNDGHYTDKGLTCTAGTPPTFAVSATPQQGANEQCVFLGKLMHFEQGTTPNDYEVFSLAGNRLSAGAPAVTLAAADPTPVVGGGIDLTTHQTIAQNLDVGKLTIYTPASVPGYEFGFIQGLGAASTTGIAGAPLDSGAQHLSLVYAPGIVSANTNAGEPTIVTAITGNLAFADSAKLCLTDGTRYAEITVGTNNNQLGVRVKLGLSVCS